MGSRHLLVYVKWGVIRDWKRGRRARRPVADDAPYAYGSRQARLLQLARPGDIVWVFSAPRFATYRLPPSLVARLRVANVVDRRNLARAEAEALIPKGIREEWHYVVIADRSDSRYYSLNNAYRTLKSLNLARQGSTLDPEECAHCRRLVTEGKELYAGLPAHLQTLRQLAPGAEADLEDFARAVAGRKVVFLSYRRKEASQLAAKLVRNLTEEHVACWYDHWMVPQRVAGGDVLVKETLLKEAMADGLRQSTWMVALVSPTYHSSRWTELEWRQAGEAMCDPRRIRPLRRVEVLLRGKSSGEADKEIPAEDLDDTQVAAHLLNILEGA